MPQPSWRYHPSVPLLIALCGPALIAAKHFGEWLAGGWTPVGQHTVLALVGFTLTLACAIPDHLWFRQQDDTYVRKLSVGRLGQPLSLSLWWVSFTLARFFFIPGNTSSACGGVRFRELPGPNRVVSALARRLEAHVGVVRGGEGCH